MSGNHKKLSLGSIIMGKQTKLSLFAINFYLQGDFMQSISEILNQLFNNSRNWKRRDTVHVAHRAFKR